MFISIFYIFDLILNFNLIFNIRDLPPLNFFFSPRRPFQCLKSLNPIAENGSPSKSLLQCRIEPAILISNNYRNPKSPPRNSNFQINSQSKALPIGFYNRPLPGCQIVPDFQVLTICILYWRNECTRKKLFIPHKRVWERKNHSLKEISFREAKEFQI